MRTAIQELPDSLQFRNPELAAANFFAICGSLAREHRSALVNLLSGVPDTDQALNLFERLIANHAEMMKRALRRNPTVLHYVLALLGHSFWLGEGLIRDPDLLAVMAKEKYLDRIQSREDYEQSFGRYRSRSLETDISVLLARFKRREYVRILLRDVLGVATLAEVTAEISALSDVLIETAVEAAQSIMRDRYGSAQRVGPDGRLEDVPFAVLGLGKLGGSELNYSSDIDLLYVYGDGEEPEWAPMSNREYFVRLSQFVSGFLASATTDGPVFRIDLRLRPQGREGEPAVSLDSSLHYYAYIAQDWELQALIKARHTAGDVRLSRAFIRGVQRFVYRGEDGEINFSAIKTALASRERIGASRRHRLARKDQSSAIDVKLDRGGIRDIEFLVQCLQRVYGGEEQWLRTAGTLFSLQKLHDKQHISGREFHDLTGAYMFLRVIEHRLQIQRGQQIHRFPSQESDLQILARAVLGSEAVAAREFADIVRARMLAVAEIYDRIVYQQRHAEQLRSPSHTAANQDGAELLLSADQKQDSFLRDQRTSGPLWRPGRGLPGTSEARARRNLDRLWNLLDLRSREHVPLMSESVIEQVLPVLSISEYLMAGLARSPELLSMLEDLNGEHATDRTPGMLDLLGSKLWHREEKFRVAAETVLRPGPVGGFTRRLTQCADRAIAAVMAHLETKEIALCALGRLGSGECGLLSDADLLFVRSETSDSTQARKAVEQVVSALGTYTREGAMFEVDLRLRPRGREGELVYSPAEVLAYFDREAQPWEILTYTKLRFVAGDEQVASSLCKGISPLLRKRSRQASFISAVREMRAKLEATHTQNPASKRRAGGFYDIDFAQSLLMLQSSLPLGGTTQERLERLLAENLLEPETYRVLSEGAAFYRTLSHATEVVTGTIQLPGNEETVMDIAQLTRQLLFRDQAPHDQAWNLHQEMKRQVYEVRLAFDRIVNASNFVPVSA